MINYMVPSISHNSKKSISSCIHSSAYNATQINSMGHLFEVHYVKNADQDCINPYFPAISITTKTEHNAWLHIIYTDNKNYKWQHFIDTTDSKTHPTIYPFYTLEQDFYDAPFWKYTFFSKPLSFWKGHAYAVLVDYHHKTIKYVGGIEWGYRLSYFHLYPQIITPTNLN